MKQIILKQLTLVNFRGEKSRTTKFNDDVTTILGRNGSGKTRHFDAFTWLLFGKDTEDRKDFNIKSYENGKELEKTDVEVEAVLQINSEKLTLKRVYTEKWVKPYGQTEEVFKGNETKCFWNNAPVKITEYTNRVNKIIDCNLFKMITNPLFFPNMKWQDQREQLFQLAGKITDDEIIEQNKDFKLLMDKLSEKSLIDFKTELSSTKRKLNDELKQIQPRIDQTQKLMPNITPNELKELEKQDKALKAEIKKLETKLSNSTALKEEESKKILEKQTLIYELKKEQQNTIYQEEKTAEEVARKSNHQREELQRKLKDLQDKIADDKSDISKLENKVADYNAKIESLNKENENLREQWYKLNEQKADVESNKICPVCNQPLPLERLDQYINDFNENKKQRLTEITERGKAKNKEIEELKAKITDINNKTNDFNEEIEQITNLTEEIEELLKNTPETKVEKINPLDIPGYQKLQTEIEKNENELKKLEEGLKGSNDNSNINAELEKLREEKGDVSKKLAQKELKEKYNEEIDTLNARGKELGQLIADIEKQEYVIKEYTKTKINLSEERINKKFKLVKFKLFDYTIEGNEFETCLPIVNGVPFNVTNTAGQINAGLDIINTLTEHYQITAPIFIDRRESVNELIDTKSQIINLKVSDDSELIIK